MAGLSASEQAILRKIVATQAEHGRQITRLARRSPARYVAQEGGTSEVYDDDGNLRAVVGELDDGTYGVAVGPNRDELEPLATTVQVAGKTTTTRALTEPGDEPANAGDVWYQTDEDGRVIGWWIGDGEVWQPQEVTGIMLAVDALDGRLITGTTLRTAAAGERIVVRPDDSAGLIEAFSGGAKEAGPTTINPYLGPNGEPGIEVRTGPSTDSAFQATLLLKSGTTAAGVPVRSAVSVFAEDIILTVNEAVTVGGSVFATGSVHGYDLYADNETGTGTVGASLTAQGRVVRTPSTRRVKRDIQPMSLETAEKVLAIEPVTFRLKAEESEDGPVYPGFIAEQAAEAGADLWVTRDTDGEPAGIRYAEVVAALVAIVNDARAKHDALEARVADLEAANKTLLARVNKLTPRL